MKTKGSVKSLVVTQEPNAVTMRFVLETPDRGSMPCELRGERINGVINDNDEVELKKGRNRNRSGIVRPVKIFNHTTSSTITVKRRGVLSRFFGLIFSAAASVLIGVLATLIADSYRTERRVISSQSLQERRRDNSPEPSSIADSLPFGLDQIPLAVLVGIGSALLVFLLLVSRRR